MANHYSNYMKLHRLALTASLAGSLFLSSCASKFTDAQRAGLSTVAVAKGSVHPDAYEEPYGGDIQARNAASNVQGAGALGVLVGAAVGSAIAGTQNASFNGKNKSHFPAIERNTPKDIGNMMSLKMKDSLKKDSFFSMRLRESSGNQFTSEVTSHRLIRITKNDDGDLLLTPQIYVNIYLKDSAGKNLAGGEYIGTAMVTHTAAEYAGSAEKLKQAYSAALDNAVQAFMAGLAMKTQP